ncbi:MAG: DUF896 domain-containing protein [Veillonellaceae bacterium]|nr:DUF896 domain-containing protein [Veillonellaceae bacterium]
MITKELIDRINELSRKQREFGLTDEETAEQAVLRRSYLDGIKSQVRQQLDSAQIPAKSHAAGCSCGCHGEHRH